MFNLGPRYAHGGYVKKDVAGHASSVLFAANYIC
jgi:hypothetical protein